MNYTAFKKRVWDHYKRHGRHDLPWRKTTSPYKILISEIMLQQTQVDRVIPKYKEFVKEFPSFAALARAPFSRILKLWSGLGYNRRARYLWEIAKIVANERGGRLPREQKELERLPGIGTYTAGAVRAFAWNEPSAFLETNVRTVLLHHFFKNKKRVSDGKLLEIAEKVLDAKQPREWYWALMDYGAYLKQEGVRINSKSKHYVKQSRFEGSDRQIRGAVLRLLLDKKRTVIGLITALEKPTKRVEHILHQLEKERLIARKGAYFYIV